MTVRETESSIIFENDAVRFTVGRNGSAVGLFLKETKEELLADTITPLFSITQDRFFDNELKLMYTARRLTAVSDSIRYENGCLVAGFSPLPYEAVISVTEKNGYFVFTLSDFNFPGDTYRWLSLARPPAVSMRILQLNIRERKYFGEWLNVCHDQKAAVAVMGAMPETIIGNEKTDRGRLLFAEAKKGILFKGCSAVLAAGEKKNFLSTVDRFEEDFNLPRGVKSRQCEKINASAYWVQDATPGNIDEHIENALKGGFSMMLMYYTCFVKEENGYSLCGNYELRDEYENGLPDVRRLIEKIKANGIIPGFHFLHSHIGLNSICFTPEADRRVMHRQHLTLREGIDESATKIYVDQYPFETELPENCRILRFGTELIHYDGCTDTEPYCYTGCVRGYNGTKAQGHPAGCGGGVVHISEFGGTSGYCDQNSSLQDEIAEKIAEIYNQGFQFIYYDGSEGVNAPYEYQIPKAQYRVYEKLNEPPLYCEAAAKGHFSWHILSGGNAFDIFPTERFKAMINKYPLSEAPVMQMDFTRLNFGWWGYFQDSRPDVFEYGTSHAAGWDCPVTIQASLDTIRKNPRSRDNLEVLRRWEDVRRRRLLTDEQKRIIREPDREFTLLMRADGEYELTECFPVKGPSEDITIYRFIKNGKCCAMLCHNTGEARIFLPLKGQLFMFADGREAEVCEEIGGISFTLSDRCILEAELSSEALERSLAHCKII